MGLILKYIFRNFFLLIIAKTAFSENSHIGEIHAYKTKYEDNFYDIARKFNLGINELVMANPNIDPWVPGEGINLVIPSMYLFPSKPHKKITINLAEMRLYFFSNDSEDNKSFPISIGILEYKTPTGNTKILYKQLNPYWIAPPSMKNSESVIIPPRR